MNKQDTSKSSLKSEIAGTVSGFDPQTKTWIPVLSTKKSTELPHLDGQLFIDPALLTAFADDVGHIIHRHPAAVLKPGSINDIIHMVQFARQHRLKIGARGQGHTTFGQSQVAAGIVVDMSTLNAPPLISSDRVEVGAGVTWKTLLLATLAHNLMPPVLTGYLGLSVGGTLSVGGIGGSGYRFGAQVDNVLELQVVTGAGQLEICSPSQNPDLFEAALAGLGQCALIVRATLRLVPAETHTRLCLLFYADLPTMLHDERLLIADGRFDHVVGYVLPGPDGQWVFFIEAARYFSPPTAPSNARLLEGLSFVPGAEQLTDLPFFDFANRVEAEIEALKANGRFTLPHPWFDMFVPDSQIDEYAANIFTTLTPDDLGPDFPILFFPLKSQKFKQPLLCVPDEEIFFLFDILRSAPDDPVVVDRMLTSNRELFERARQLGSKHYTISAITLSKQDWKRHFQPVWGKLVSAKHRFDPDNVLTPGPGIF
ncbi:MAG: FAD-binding protein [Anaerolineales bacterium]|nr:FAD-binding protein [Anaerolineales bacterium]